MSETNQPQQQTRQKGETSKAHSAYIDYRDMGVNRSLRKLHESYNAPDAPPDCPTKNLSTIEGWSSRYSWQDRIKEWEQHLYDQRETIMDQERHAERQRRSGLIDEMFNKISELLDIFHPDPEVQIKHVNSTMRALKSYMDISMKHYNDLPTERKDLTSKDKAISVNFITEPVSEDLVNKRLQEMGLANYVEDQTE